MVVQVCNALGHVYVRLLTLSLQMEVTERNTHAVNDDQAVFFFVSDSISVPKRLFPAPDGAHALIIARCQAFSYCVDRF